MRGSDSPFRVYADRLESYDSFVVCGVVNGVLDSAQVLGLWIRLGLRWGKDYYNDDGDVPLK